MPVAHGDIFFHGRSAKVVWIIVMHDSTIAGLWILYSRESSCLLNGKPLMKEG